jgi:hypothetical protein
VTSFFYYQKVSNANQPTTTNQNWLKQRFGEISIVLIKQYTKEFSIIKIPGYSTKAGIG